MRYFLCLKGGDDLARSYYGDKISENIIETPEGYIICKNVPVGRIGWMEYQGHELPAIFQESGPCKVFRSPEEVFNKKTVSSFEGKPVTNTHPHENLTIDTVSMAEKGHIQDVRRDGDFLVGDLYIMDLLLKEEVLNKMKREISCGYDCLWVPLGDGKYEQKDIIGNHIAVVQNGRAGPHAAIQDKKPDKFVDDVPEDTIMQIKEKTGGKKRMKMSKRLLAAMGLKHFAQDADPEEIAHAMEAMREDEQNKALFSKTPGSDDDYRARDDDRMIRDDRRVRDDDDDDDAGGSTEVMSDLCDKINQILSRIEQLESREEQQQGQGAEDDFAGLENEMKSRPPMDDDETEIPEQQARKYEDVEESPSSKMSGPAHAGYDDDDDDVENTFGQENTKYMNAEQGAKDKRGRKKSRDDDDDDDEGESAELYKKAADFAFRKHVKDMKKAILAVEDPKLRNQLAKKFVASVQDARQVGNRTKYGDIANQINSNKRHRAVDASVQQDTMSERAQKAVAAWNKAGAAMRQGVNK